jgi:hypothetical protein
MTAHHQYLPQWETIRRLAEELEVKMHLAGMEARDRWQSLQPRLRELESALSTSGKRIGAAIDREVNAVSTALERLRDDLDVSDD